MKWISICIFALITAINTAGPVEATDQYFKGFMGNKGLEPKNNKILNKEEKEKLQEFLKPRFKNLFNLYGPRGTRSFDDLTQSAQDKIESSGLKGVKTVGELDNNPFGTPLQLFQVQLDDIQKYQEGDNLEGLLIPTHAAFIPVEAGQPAFDEKAIDKQSFVPLIPKKNISEDGTRWDYGMPKRSLWYEKLLQFRDELVKSPEGRAINLTNEDCQCFGITYDALPGYFFGSIISGNFTIRPLKHLRDPEDRTKLLLDKNSEKPYPAHEVFMKLSYEAKHPKSHKDFEEAILPAEERKGLREYQ